MRDCACRKTATACRAAVVFTLAVSLASCGGGSLRDLQTYVAEIKQRKGRGVAELPPIEPYIVFEYPGTGRDPFKPFFNNQGPDDGENTGVADNGIRPDFDRKREELEQHPLDSLRMQGTLEKGEQVWGIIRSPDSIIHRVQVGNYMGNNHGKILAINEERIELLEIIPDGQGGWVERDAAIALAE